MRKLLLPLSPVYGMAMSIRNRAYDRRVLTPRKLPAPVISVGNLSTGGTGKTPFVASLARLLLQHGRRPVVLSRGYGRTSTSVQRVPADGHADQFGDEPLLLARTTGVPVYVGADRYQAGLLALQELPTDGQTLFLLDDGMQHRRLARDMEIVLLSASDLTDHSLPSGNLREPLSSLSRADALVFREQDIALAPRFLRRFEHPSCGRPVLWSVRRTLDGSTLAALPPGAAVAFAGIAHPGEFFEQLRASGVTLPATLSFPDHYQYTFRDVTRILASFQAAKLSANVTMLLTTEKDMVRLDAQALAALQTVATVVAVPLATQLAEPEVCLQQIDALCMRQF